MILLAGISAGFAGTCSTFIDKPLNAPSTWAWTVKTTIELPDELLRRARMEAASNGRSLRDLLEEGLRLVLDMPRGRRCGLADLMASARGVVDSGVPDLASDPAHLVGFGRDVSGNQ